MEMLGVLVTGGYRTLGVLVTGGYRTQSLDLKKAAPRNRSSCFFDRPMEGDRPKDGA